MDSTDSKPFEAGDAIAARPPRRWFQFRLRTLLLIVGVCGVVAFLWRTLADALPYREQRRTMALVARLGGTYQTAEASNWHKIAVETCDFIAGTRRRLFGSDLQNLVLVNLMDCDAADDYIGAVAGSPKLETLVVGGEAFGDEHLRQLQGATLLRHLVLDSTSVTDEAIAALRAAQPKVEVYISERRAIAALRRLGPTNLQSRPVPPALESIVQQHFFDTFERGCFGGSCGDAEAANVRHFKNVRELILGHSTVTDAALSHVSNLQSLRVLRLSGRPITDAGVEHLARLTGLEELTLHRAPITDAGLERLKDLTNLRVLDLGGTRITDSGLMQLKDLKKLGFLNLNSTDVTEAAVPDLQQTLPSGCNIVHSPRRK
jgi:internalin A